MTAARYLLRSLLFYWRMHLGLFLGALLAAMILTGSLAVGDSVRFSLAELAKARLGKTAAALVAPEHFFREELASETDAPILLMRGTVRLPDGSARANEVQIIGVDERFWAMGGSTDLLAGGNAEAFAINERLANRLGVKPGATVIVRLEEPSLLSRDAPLSGDADASIALRGQVKAVAGAEQFGLFSLQANQVPPLTLFLPLRILQEAIKQPGRVNGLLTENGAEAANQTLRKAWKLADLGLEVRSVADGTQELRTERVFLEPAVAAAATKAPPHAAGVLTYLVNELRLGEKTTPYSMVTATDAAPGFPPLADDEIAINSWLAEDLGAKPGDTLTLRYYVAGTNRQLSEQTSRFKVRVVYPLERPDESWMPSFPGLSDVENCRDWQPGIPIETGRIRPKDEAYWNQYKGTPKAFLNLRAGQSIWSNRFGNLTAIRYPAASVGEVERAVREQLDPVAAGLRFQPVREAALAASNGSQDFGQLFIGFSFFLIVAALLLMAMLFVFNLEQRAGEMGLLLAIGLDHRQVRRLLLREGYALAVLGGLAGVCAGSLYTKLALHGLSSVWHGAVNFTAFRYHATGLTLAIGGASSLCAGLLATWLAGRSQARRPTAQLLASGAELEISSFAPKPNRSLWIGSVCFLTAVALSIPWGGQLLSAEAFFSAGALLLMAGLAFSHAWLVQLSRATRNATRLAQIGLRAAARRRGRSLTTVAVLASGVFMVVSVGAFRPDPLANAHAPGSGTGGFALYGQATLPIYENLNTEAGRKAFGLSSELMRSTAIVPLRVKEGDDASCLNLNRARQPRLLGVRTEALAARRAFTFLDTLPGTPPGTAWRLLEQPAPDGAIPAIGDEATTRWALGKRVGDLIPCIDDRGNTFNLRLVGVLANSILQGSLIISEQTFQERFPSASGSRVFLIDAPQKQTREVAKELSMALQNRGLELVPAWQRLAEFAAVESSYLSIFQALGGLGLLLGSAGLGIVVMRNVLERRSELALLAAVGFSPRSLRWLVVSEHWALIALGVGIGGVAALVALLPSLLTPGVHASFAGPALTLCLLAAGGAAWSWLAAWLALRGSLLEALRSE